MILDEDNKIHFRLLLLLVVAVITPGGFVILNNEIQE